MKAHRKWLIDRIAALRKVQRPLHGEADQEGMINGSLWTSIELLHNMYRNAEYAPNLKSQIERLDHT